MLLSIGITKFFRAFYTPEPHFLECLHHKLSYVVLLFIAIVAVRTVFRNKLPVTNTETACQLVALAALFGHVNQVHANLANE